MLWAPAFRLAPASASAACAAPPNFPASIELYQQAFEIGQETFASTNCGPARRGLPADVMTLADWAHENGYRLRPRGHMHNWSPLTVTTDSTCAATRVVLVETTRHMNSMKLVSSAPAAVRVQTGAALEELLTFLEQAGYGLTATPAPGDLTVGGVLAIDAHGTAVPARGETRVAGHTYGTLSDLVLSVTAVVWDKARRRYVIRTFDRSAPECKAFLVHLGRAFVIEVTLQVGANYNLRCVSRVDIPARELFASPGSGASRTFASFAEAKGRAEAIWFPFTANPLQNLLLYVRPTTLRVTANGYAVLTSRSNLQRVIADFISFTGSLSRRIAPGGSTR